MLPIPEQRLVDEGDAVGAQSDAQRCGHVLVGPAFVPGRVAEHRTPEQTCGWIGLHLAPHEHASEFVAADSPLTWLSRFGNSESSADRIDEHRSARGEVGIFADQRVEHAGGERGVGEVVAVEEPDHVTGCGTQARVSRIARSVIAVEFDDTVFDISGREDACRHPDRSVVAAVVDQDHFVDGPGLAQDRAQARLDVLRTSIHGNDDRQARRFGRRRHLAHVTPRTQSLHSGLPAKLA